MPGCLVAAVPCLDTELHRRRARLLRADIGARKPVVEVGNRRGGAVAGASRLEAEIAGARREIGVGAAARGVDREPRSAGSPAVLLGARAGIADAAVVQVEVGIAGTGAAVGADRVELGPTVDVHLVVDMPDVVAADEVVQRAAGFLDAGARAE